MKNLKLKLTWPPQTEKIEQAFTHIYSSGDWWKYSGERAKKLEQEFPRSHDCRSKYYPKVLELTADSK